MTEITVGDALFFLDYEDINNKDFGMYDIVDGEKKSYADMFNMGWSSWRDNYPGEYELSSSIKANYLKDRDLAASWFLRNWASYTSMGGGAGMVVWSESGVVNSTSKDQGVRPAFNFNPSSIMYANAHTSAITSSTFTALSAAAKPAYKLYLKDDTYAVGTKPMISVSGNTLSVNYSNKGAATQAVALLTTRDSANHKVEYQANTSLTADNGKAVFNIPSSVDIDKYNITIMFTSNNGGFSTESVYAQYDYDSVLLGYYNLESGSDVALGNTVSTEYTQVNFGEDLYVPSEAANHVYRGWTLDKTGASEPFKTMNSWSCYGNKLYAMWGISGEVDDLTAEDNITEINYGEGSIKLSASASVAGMTTPTVTYRWYKDGGTTAVHQGANYTLTLCTQSGAYSVEYTIKDGKEPLWFGTKKISKSITATINKGEVRIRDGTFKLDEATPPYVGAELSKVKFSAIFEDMKGNIVTGSAEWEYSIAKITDSGGLSNTFNIIFTPDDGDVYKEMTLPVTFEAEYIKLNFNLMQIRQTLPLNMTYNQNYTAEKIVSMFQSEFTKKTMDDSTKAIYEMVAHRTPVLDGTDIQNFDTDYLNYVKSVTINVDFIDKPYTVTYNYNDDPANPTIKEDERKYTYNQFILKPEDPKLEGSVFIGWFYDAINDSGATEEKQWDFDVDHIYDDITLTAKWLTLKLTLDSITLTSNKPDGFTALDTIKAGDITVIATYTTDNDDTPTVDIKLDFGKYNVIYESGAVLHVSTPRIKVSYTEGGITKESEFTEILVNPIKISPIKSGYEDRFPFKDISLVETGGALIMPAIPSSMLDEHISTYTYTYLNGGIEVTGDITTAGTYGVIAKFTTNSPDYAVDDMSATMTVRRAAEKVYLEWDYDSANPYTYNGKPQHPQAVLKDADGNILDYIDFEYEGDIDATNVKTGYEVSVSITDGGFTVDGDTSIRFDIVKAIVPVPTLKEGIQLIYD
ncbi:MAG: InlB B-repeat-containing protein, partial [Clostridia bacterium]|nr:InlB B-repeat-containing protein [Clostridia bacterium]